MGVGRNQDFAPSKLGGEISHFKRDVWNLPDEIRDRGVRFETHPLHTELAFLVADKFGASETAGAAEGHRRKRHRWAG